MEGVSTPSASTKLVISSVEPISSRCAVRLRDSLSCSQAPKPRLGRPAFSAAGSGPTQLEASGTAAGMLPPSLLPVEGADIVVAAEDCASC